MKDVVGLLNELILNTLIFQFLDHYQEVLPAELRSSKKGLINIKNNDQKCFLWCHIRQINLVKIHPERITQKDKEMINDPDYKGIESKKDFSKIEVKNKICISVLW